MKTTATDQGHPEEERVPDLIDGMTVVGLEKGRKEKARKGRKAMQFCIPRLQMGERYATRQST